MGVWTTNWIGEVGKSVSWIISSPWIAAIDRAVVASLVILLNRYLHKVARPLDKVFRLISLNPACVYD